MGKEGVGGKTNAPDACSVSSLSKCCMLEMAQNKKKQTRSCMHAEENPTANGRTHHESPDPILPRTQLNCNKTLFQECTMKCYCFEQCLMDPFVTNFFLTAWQHEGGWYIKYLPTSSSCFLFCDLCAIKPIFR